MPLRLLTKSQIATAQSIDKAREIQEGLKISKRVDGIRELKAKEESEFEKFRTETLSSIGREIETLNKTKEAIILEIRDFREEKRKGLRDVEQGLLSVTSFRAVLDQRESYLKELEQRLLRKQDEINATLLSSKDELERSRTHKEESERLHLVAQNNHEASMFSLKAARKTEETTLLLKEALEKELSHRQQIIAQMEQDIIIKEKEIKNTKKELKTKEAQLLDREATVTRDFNRLHKNERRKGQQ